MVKSTDFVNVGGFDDEYKKAFGDIALCLKLRKKGLLNVFNPYAEGILDAKPEILADTTDEFEADLTKFKKDFEKELEDGDPYYNKNLTKTDLDYSIM